MKMNLVLNYLGKQIDEYYIFNRTQPIILSHSSLESDFKRDLRLYRFCKKLCFTK